jgi:NADH-quinone oxidoreductase subunit C
MDAAQIGKILVEKFGDAILETKTDVSQGWAKVSPRRILEICAFLKDDPETRFDFLRAVSGVDYIDEKELEVVYLLFSYPKRHEFKVKARIPRDNPRIPSVHGVWPAADWHEREAYDLFGIEFEGHPDLRRIMLPDDWVGYPLRKDYKEADEYRGVSTTRPYPTGMPELPTLPSKPVESHE